MKLAEKYKAMEVLHKNARKQYESLSKQVNELRAGSMNLGKKVTELTLASSAITQSKIIEKPAKNFEKANQLAKFGATADEIMQECQLCNAEAELILNMNKNTHVF